MSMKKHVYQPQVGSDIYLTDDYLGIGRFLSYREQVMSVLELAKAEPIDTIAEIGIGNVVTSSLLRNFGFRPVTIDFDPKLNPDIVCSVTELRRKVKKQFDVVLCYEVLEHLKFSDFKNALQNISAITRRYLIMSLPYAGLTFKVHLYLSKYGERQLNIIKRIPLFWKSHVVTSEHYWEPGKKGFSRRRVRRNIARYFEIQKEWLSPYNYSQIFYLCKKKLAV